MKRDPGKPRLNLLDQTFGQLTVIADDGNKNGRSYWLCKCSCGNTKSVSGKNLTQSKEPTRSCGCLRINNITKHGMTNTYVHKVWKGIKCRCFNPNHHSYSNYGGKGITMFEEWADSFEKFYQYVGEPPTLKHSIDRIENDKGYFPGDIRWATATQQSRNQTTTILSEELVQQIREEIKLNPDKSYIELAKKYGTSPKNISYVATNTRWATDSSTPILKKVRFTREVAIEIRGLFNGEAQLTVRELADKFNCTERKIKDIILNRNHKDSNYIPSRVVI